MAARRRFPPPWSIEERPACYIVKDGGKRARAGRVWINACRLWVAGSGQYRRSAAKLRPMRRGGFAANIAKLPDLLRKQRWGTIVPQKALFEREAAWYPAPTHHQRYSSWPQAGRRPGHR